MLSLTLARLFNCFLLASLVVVGSLASGCQSSRPGFSFQPIRLRTVAPMPPEARARPAEAPTAAVPNAAALAPAAVTARVLPTRPAAEVPFAQVSTQPKHAPAQLLGAAATQTTAAAAPASTQAAASFRRALLHRAHAPARQGLGLTVLGLLGMVVLVVALVGLAISGGGVGWLITAAVAAGVVLLAYLDPGGH